MACHTWLLYSVFLVIYGTVFKRKRGNHLISWKVACLLTSDVENVTKRGINLRYKNQPLSGQKWPDTKRTRLQACGPIENLRLDCCTCIWTRENNLDKDLSCLEHNGPTLTSLDSGQWSSVKVKPWLGVWPCWCCHDINSWGGARKTSLHNLGNDFAESIHVVSCITKIVLMESVGESGSKWHTVTLHHSHKMLTQIHVDDP